jgi:hypothetical protein
MQRWGITNRQKSPRKQLRETATLCVHVFNDPERLGMLMFGQSSVGG